MDSIKPILKEIALAVFSPSALVVILLSAGVILLLTNKIKIAKIVLLVTLILTFIFSYNPIVDFVLDLNEKHYKTLSLSTLNQEQKDNIKFIVVLAGGYSSGNNIPLSSKLAPHTLTRLIEGLTLHKDFPSAKLVFTGKGWAQKTEAQAMQEMALKLGVKKTDIILDNKSMNTYEHTIYLKEIIKDETFLLVTSALHIQRAMGMFLKAGYKPIAAPTDHQLKRKYNLFSKSVFTSKGANIYNSDLLFQEYLARIWARLVGRI